VYLLGACGYSEYIQAYNNTSPPTLPWLKKQDPSVLIWGFIIYIVFGLLYFVHFYLWVPILIVFCFTFASVPHHKTFTESLKQEFNAEKTTVKPTFLIGLMGKATPAILSEWQRKKTLATVLSKPGYTIVSYGLWNTVTYGVTDNIYGIWMSCTHFGCFDWWSSGWTWSSKWDNNYHTD